MVGMIPESPFAQRPRHDVERVHLVAIGAAAGMMTLGHQNDIAVRNRHGFIQRALLGEDPLETEPLFGIETMIIGFLKLGHVGIVILVMTMRRIARPVALRGEDLGHQKTVGDFGLFHRDGMNMAGIGPLAAFDHADVFDHARRVVAPARCRTDRKGAPGGRPGDP